MNAEPSINIHQLEITGITIVRKIVITLLYNDRNYSKGMQEINLCRRFRTNLRRSFILGSTDKARVERWLNRETAVQASCSGVSR